MLATSGRRPPSRVEVLLVALALVGFLAGASRADILGVKDVLPPSGRKLSNGTTPVALFAATTHKTTVIAGAAVVNRDTANHTCTFLSEPSGTVLREFDLSPSPAGALIDEVQNIQSLPGEGISFAIDSGGTGNTVTVTAQATAR